MRVGKYRDIFKNIENILYFRFFRYFQYIYIYRAFARTNQKIPVFYKFWPLKLPINLTLGKPVVFLLF